MIHRAISSPLHKITSEKEMNTIMMNFNFQKSHILEQYYKKLQKLFREIK